MKKILFTAGTLAMFALASCSNDETTSSSLVNPDEISYQVVTNNASRANSLFKAGDKITDGFYVSAFKKADDNNGAAYFQNEKVDYTDGAYKPVNSRYWPAFNLDFFAWTQPAGATANTTTADGVRTLTISNVSIPEDVNATNGQKDILYAVTLNQGKSDGETGHKGHVKLNFRHALAQLVFKFKNESEGLHIDVAGVKLVNIKNTGDLKIKSTSTIDQYINGDTYKTPTCDWSLGTTAASAYFYRELASGSTTKYQTYLPVAKGDAASIFKATNSSAADYEAADAMFVIPQTVNPLSLTSQTALANITDMYFLIRCRIYNVAGSAVDRNNDVQLWGKKNTNSEEFEAGSYADVLVPVKALSTEADANKWEAGKRYIYTFIFGRDGGNGGYDPEDPDGPDPDDPVLKTITYDVQCITVDDWADYAGNDVQTEMKTN